MPRKILLIEDEKASMKAARKCIKRKGYSHTVAPDCMTALEEANSGGYDGAFVDMFMPLGRGIQVEELIGVDMFHNVVKEIGTDVEKENLVKRLHITLDDIHVPSIYRDEFETDSSDKLVRYDQLLDSIKEGIRKTGVLPFGMLVMETLTRERIPAVITSSAGHANDPLLFYMGGKGWPYVQGMFGKKTEDSFWNRALYLLEKRMEMGPERACNYRNIMRD